jgi:hypothetical protein
MSASFRRKARALDGCADHCGRHHQPADGRVQRASLQVRPHQGAAVAHPRHSRRRGKNKVRNSKGMFVIALATKLN